MVTRKDIRFRDHWLEQKSGPRWKYYLQFSIAWMIVSFLCLFFLTKLFTTLWETGGRDFIFLLLGLSAVLGFVITHLTYLLSERRLKKIEEAENKADLN